MGLTRQELLARSIGTGLVLGTGGMSAFLSACSGDDDDTTADPGKPQRGGRLRFGGAGQASAFDPQTGLVPVDRARVVAVYETLTTHDKDFNVAFDGLAEEVEPGSTADVWTIRLKDGVEFHNGKTLSADDIIYSLRRIVDPELGLFGGLALSSIDPNGMTKLDARTVRLKLKRLDGTIADALAVWGATIVPDGTPTKPGNQPPPGTGPFDFKTYTPREPTLHTRNPNYWRTGEPYFDEVEIIDFADATARVNALLGGQLDAMMNVPPGQVSVVNGGSDTALLESTSAAWTPISMNIARPPFDDLRVRQAIRLIADRKQLVEQALAGHGQVANDLYSLLDPLYNDELPQREQDLEQARSLLRAAGQENLTVTYVTAPVEIGMVEAGTVFAEQAREAGVTVKVRSVDEGTLYGDQYLQWPFTSDSWTARNYLTQVAQSSLPTAAFNATHWPNEENKRFSSLYEQALRETDDDRRREVVHEMQRMEHEEGGYLIWGFSNTLDGYNKKVKGLVDGQPTILSLNHFARGFRTIWFS